MGRAPRRFSGLAIERKPTAAPVGARPSAPVASRGVPRLYDDGDEEVEKAPEQAASSQETDGGHGVVIKAMLRRPHGVVVKAMPSRPALAGGNPDMPATAPDASDEAGKESKQLDGGDDNPVTGKNRLD